MLTVPTNDTKGVAAANSKKSQRLLSRYLPLAHCTSTRLPAFCSASAVLRLERASVQPLKKSCGSMYAKGAASMATTELQPQIAEHRRKLHCNDGSLAGAHPQLSGSAVLGVRLNETSLPHDLVSKADGIKTGQFAALALGHRPLQWKH